MARSVLARSRWTSRSPSLSGLPSLKNTAVEDGQRLNRLAPQGIESATWPSMGKPLSASAMAGAISSASVNRPEPYFRSASASPATVPGTPTASPESRDFFGSGLPAASRNMVLRARAGAVSR